LESFLLFLNYIIFVLPKVLFYGRIYDVLITDRYVYDFILSRRALGDDSQIFIRILTGMCPRPEVVILLDVNEGLAYNRKGGEKSMNELRLLRKLYLSISTKCRYHIVDGSKLKPTVFNEIRRIVEAQLND
jgi:thymidylate kinase